MTESLYKCKIFCYTYMRTDYHGTLNYTVEEGNSMYKGIFRKMAAAGLAIMMLVALAPGVGMASPVYFTVTYRANAPGNQTPMTDTAVLGQLYLVMSNSFTNNGMVFNGWNSSPNGTGQNYVPGTMVTVAANLDLYAQWRSAGGQTVTIRYNSNGGGQADITDSSTSGAAYVVRGAIFSRANYTLESWNTQQNGNGTRYTLGQNITANTDLTLYAQWTQTGGNTVTITYKANYAGGPADVIDTPTRGSSYTVRNNPFTRAGFTFAGWNTQAGGSGNAIREGQQVTANANNTLYAQWTQTGGNTVTITYKSNYAGGPADVVDTVNKGSSYTIRSNPFNRPGYEFISWNQQPAGSGKMINPGQTFTPQANQVLYAQWKDSQTASLTVTYMPNGGNGQASVIDHISRGSSYSIRANPFTRSGYSFNGWNTQPNGTGTAMSPGQVMIIDNSYTFYAQWISDDMIVEIPTGVDGRILPPWKSGDMVNWIEIARNGKYSLIVRQVSICNVRFSDTNNDYWTSYLRGLCNNFFNTIKDYTQAPKPISLLATLPQNVRLRAYTVETNALYTLGTSSNFASLYDGYSKPTRFNARAGNDICFALSYTEAANFLSRVRFIRGANPNLQPSPELAISNYLKIVPIPQLYTDIWLRSPGDVNGTNSAITYSTTLQHGTVFQKNQVYETANVHPALWVDSAVFD